jgi:hypothetical protein
MSATGRHEPARRHVVMTTRGEHSAAPAPNDQMVTTRLLRRKLKAAAMTAMGHEPPRPPQAGVTGLTPIAVATAPRWSGRFGPIGDKVRHSKKGAIRSLRRRGLPMGAKR